MRGTPHFCDILGKGVLLVSNHKDKSGKSKLKNSPRNNSLGFLKCHCHKNQGKMENCSRLIDSEKTLQVGAT